MNIAQSVMASVFTLSGLTLAASDQSWKVKPIPEWTKEDAKEVMTDSPWAKSVAAASDKTANHVQQGQRPRRMAGHLAIRVPGVSGISRHGRVQPASGEKRDSPPAGPEAAPKVILRWESALPIREAELKAADVGAPDVDETHYAIAVFGFPRGSITDNSKATSEALRRQAILKPDLKREMKPSSVDIFIREDGVVLVYLFPKSNEITWRDHRVEFKAQVKTWKFSHVFLTDEMFFHGVLEM